MGEGGARPAPGATGGQLGAGSAAHRRGGVLVPAGEQKHQAAARPVLVGGRHIAAATVGA